MNKAKEIYAKRLKEARASAKMTMKELGIQAGIDEFLASSRISRYENAVHLPSLEDAYAIAEALDLPMGFFVTENDDIANLLLKVHRLTDAQRHHVSELADLVESDMI